MSFIADRTARVKLIAFTRGLTCILRGEPINPYPPKTEPELYEEFEKGREKALEMEKNR